ncbi:MAG: permease [Dehalococcoidia bacterium]|nr:permease [Dehalococcoidia bacterium]MDD5494653.1 permease [Dehalococcoidia bacterium]
MKGTDIACSCNTAKGTQLPTSKKPLSRPWLYSILCLGLTLWVFIYCWLEPAAKFITYDLFKIPASSQLGSSIEFFIYDAPKVILLLILIIFGVGIIRSFFSPERTRQILAGKKEFVGNVLAGGLGIVTPFCSCSAVPLFIGFVETGIPLGVTLSFLIASPMINEVALVMLYGMFGWQVALLYLITGLVIAITAGWVIGKLKMERHIESWVFDIKAPDALTPSTHMAFEDRIYYGLNAVRDIVGKVWPYVLAGIAVGAAIHGYVPEGLLASFMGKDAWWSVPAAVLIGIPMYSNAAGIIPVVQALMEKGAALGTALAFMMAVVGLSLPETIILRRVLKWQLIGVFIGVVAVGIIIIGYLFNAFL